MVEHNETRRHDLAKKAVVAGRVESGFIFGRKRLKRINSEQRPVNVGRNRTTRSLFEHCKMHMMNINPNRRKQKRTLLQHCLGR
jgi:hypothetical protein